MAIEGVDQAMVLGEGEKYCAALIVASDGYDPQKLAVNLQSGLDIINQDLPSWETVKKYVISTTPMNIQSGELTPTMKKKRRIIIEKRKDEISQLFV